MKAKVSLGLSKMSVPTKIENARVIVSAVGSRPEFTNPIPPLADINTAADELQTAYNNAQMGGPAQTAVMRAKETQLDNLISRLGSYVEIVANEDESIILAAAMNVRGKGKRSPNQFTVVLGNSEGEVVLTSPVTPRASYVWQKSVDPLPLDLPTSSNGNKWEQIALTTLSSLTVKDLVPQTKYWFRVAPVTSAGQGLWSDPISMIAH